MSLQEDREMRDLHAEMCRFRFGEGWLRPGRMQPHMLRKRGEDGAERLREVRGRATVLVPGTIKLGCRDNTINLTRGSTT